MNNLLILDRDASIYEKEIGKYHLQSTKTAVADNEAEAELSLAPVNIIFGIPALVAGVVNKIEILQWVQSICAGVEQLCNNGLNRNYLLTGIKDLFGSFMRACVLAYILVRKCSVLENHRNQKHRFWSGISYRSLAGVIITAHNSASSWANQVAEFFAADYEGFLAGSPLNYVVDFNRG